MSGHAPPPVPAPAPPEGEHLLSRVVRAFLAGPLSPVLLLLSLLAAAAAVAFTPREEEPQIVVPMADVFVSFPGASAEEVEQLVTTPLERLLWQVEGVEHVYSVSRRDGAMVTVRFFVGEDRERALIRLHSRIEGHRDQAPPGVAGWVVRPVEIDDVPTVTLTLWSRTRDEGELRRVAGEMKARLGAVPDLSRTEILGGLPREVRVELDPEALAARGLSPLEVLGALRAADASLSAGAFDRGNRRVAVVAGPFVGGRRDAERLVVGAHGGSPVYLRDVARVVDGPAEPDSVTRIRFGPAGAAAAGARPGESFPAVTLALSKKKGVNAVAVSAAVLERAEALRAEALPADVRLLVTRDYGATADHKVNELMGHLVLAILTLVALIAWSLGWRQGLVVAAAVPITFAFTLLLNLLVGYSVNRVTLFALVLVLGLVADDPIVDVENIHRHFARRTRSLLDTVVFAVNEVRPPVIVATLAVILSFLPLLFITGMMGPYMRPMAFNVPVAMAMSLLVAFTITPWMSLHLLRSQFGHGVEEEQQAGMRVHRGLVAFFLDSARARWALAGALLLSLGLAGVLALGGGVPLKMLPYDNKSEFQVLLDMPEGTTLEGTAAAVEDLERELARVPEVTDAEAYVGTPGPIDFNGLVRRYNHRAAPHLAEIRVNLVPREERTQQSHALTLRLRRDLEAAAARHGAAIKLVEVPPGPPVLATLVAEVGGPPARSPAELVAAAREVARRLALEEGVVDVDVMAEDPHPRLDFVLDKEKAALHGVSTEDVTRTLRLALSGADAATVHEPSEREPLRLRLVLDRARRSGAAEVSRVSVRGAAGTLVPLAELGSFAEVPEDPPIFHKDLERTVFVLGEVAGRPPAEAVFAMQASLARDPLPGGVTARWDGEGEWKVTLDVFRDLGLAFAGALVMIYVLLVATTGSFLMPLVVMVAIPLGAVAVMPGFLLLNGIAGGTVGGYADPVWFTATSMIGLIALSGIVVRNSILLIDFIEERTREGMALREAVLDAGAMRARPIMLTAGAVLLGAWPITLDPIFSGLAWALIFGVLASTLFSLLVVPVAYYALHLWRGGAGAPRVPPDSSSEASAST